MRNLNNEFADTDDRRYAYDFDYRMHEYMERTFLPHLPSGRALEMGCYHGRFTRRLERLFAAVTVVEGASDLIEVARKEVGPSVCFELCRFEEFLPEGTFDAVFLLHTLEHLDDAVAVLNRIRGWLSAEGKLFLAVPNAYAASRQIAVRMGLISHPTAVTEGEARHGHRRTYDAKSLEADVRKAGLRVIESGGIMFKPLANFQFDRALRESVIDDAYVEGCFELGKSYPELCASLFAVCQRGDGA